MGALSQMFAAQGGTGLTSALRGMGQHALPAMPEQDPGWLYKTARAIDIPGRFVRGLLLGRPGADLWRPGSASGWDILREHFGVTDKPGFDPVDLLAFGTEVLTDPLTFTLGIGPYTKGAKLARGVGAARREQDAMRGFLGLLRKGDPVTARAGLDRAAISTEELLRTQGKGRTIALQRAGAESDLAAALAKEKGLKDLLAQRGYDITDEGIEALGKRKSLLTLGVPFAKDPSLEIDIFRDILRAPGAQESILGSLGKYVGEPLGKAAGWTGLSGLTRSIGKSIGEKFIPDYGLPKILRPYKEGLDLSIARSLEPATALAKEMPEELARLGVTGEEFSRILEAVPSRRPVTEGASFVGEEVPADFAGRLRELWESPTKLGLDPDMTRSYATKVRDILSDVMEMQIRMGAATADEVLSGTMASYYPRVFNTRFQKVLQNEPELFERMFQFSPDKIKEASTVLGSDITRVKGLRHMFTSDIELEQFLNYATEQMTDNLHRAEKLVEGRLTVKGWLDDISRTPDANNRPWTNRARIKEEYKVDLFEGSKEKLFETDPAKAIGQRVILGQTAASRAGYINLLIQDFARGATDELPMGITSAGKPGPGRPPAAGGPDIPPVTPETPPTGPTAAAPPAVPPAAPVGPGRTQLFTEEPAGQVTATFGFAGGNTTGSGITPGFVIPKELIENNPKVVKDLERFYNLEPGTLKPTDIKDPNLIAAIRKAADEDPNHWFHISPECQRCVRRDPRPVGERLANPKAALEKSDMDDALGVIRIIEGAEPPVVTLENSRLYQTKTFLKADGSEFQPIEEITKALKNKGYAVDVKVFNAADYGGASSRERMILRAVKKEDLVVDGVAKSFDEVYPMPDPTGPSDWWDTLRPLMDETEDMTVKAGLDRTLRDLIKAKRITRPTADAPLYYSGGNLVGNRKEYNKFIETNGAKGSLPTLRGGVKNAGVDKAVAAPTLTRRHQTASIMYLDANDKWVRKRLSNNMMKRLMGLGDEFPLEAGMKYGDAADILGNGMHGSTTQAGIESLLRARLKQFPSRAGAVPPGGAGVPPPRPPAGAAPGGAGAPPPLEPTGMLPAAGVEGIYKDTVPLAHFLHKTDIDTFYNPLTGERLPIIKGAKEADIQRLLDDEGLGTLVMPRSIVDDATKTTQMLHGPKGLLEFMKRVGQLNAMTKIAVTQLFPGYHIRNVMSDFMLSFVAGALNPRAFRYALDAAFGFDSPMKGVGKFTSTKDIVRELRLRGAVQGGTGEAISQAERGVGGFATAEQRALDAARGALPEVTQPGIGRGVGAGIGKVSEVFQRQLTGPGVAQRVAHKLAGALPERYRDAVRDMSVGEITQLSERFTRSQHFISRVMAGDTLMDASRSVKKHLLDYGNLTPFEKTVMSPAILFYSWKRKIIPQIYRQIFENPGRMAALFRATVQPTLPRDKYVPSFIRESAAIPVGGGYLWGMGSPLEELSSIEPFSETGDLSLKRAFQKLGAQMTPVAKVPLELLFGRELFLNKPIAELDRLGSEGALLAALGMAQEQQLPGGATRFRTSPGLAYALRQAPHGRAIQTAGAGADILSELVGKDLDPRKSMWAQLARIAGLAKYTPVDELQKIRAQRQFLKTYLGQQAVPSGEVGKMDIFYGLGPKEQQSPRIRSILKGERELGKLGRKMREAMSSMNTPAQGSARSAIMGLQAR